MEKDHKPREIGKNNEPNLDSGGKYIAPVANFDIEVLASTHLGPVKVIRQNDRIRHKRVL